MLMRALSRTTVTGLVSQLHALQFNPEQSSHDSLYHRAVKTLLAYDRSLDDPIGDWETQLESALGIVESHDGICGSDRGNPSISKQLSAQDEACLRRYTRMMGRKSVRALYLTYRRQLLGLAPPLSIIGDLVCIIHGSSTPVVLRRSATQGLFHVIGQSYLEDWMHGDHVAWGENDAAVFFLE